MEKEQFINIIYAWKQMEEMLSCKYTKYKYTFSFTETLRFVIE